MQTAPAADRPVTTGAAASVGTNHLTHQERLDGMRRAQILGGPYDGETIAYVGPRMFMPAPMLEDDCAVEAAPMLATEVKTLSFVSAMGDDGQLYYVPVGTPSRI